MAERTSAIQRLGPLLVLLAVEAVACLVLAVSRTVPSGHDAFQYFYLKYYFFNDFVKNGEIAQWLPYLTHGSPAAWWYIVQSGIFDPLAMWVARLLHLNNFFIVFYILLFCERLLLIVGTWLLAAEHFKSRPAIFAATAAVVHTCIGYSQPWWNFHAILPLPLMLFCLHRTIMDFDWKWLVGLSLLLFLQTFGQLSYYLPITLLFLAAYAAVLLAHAEARTALRARFRMRPIGVMATLAVNGAFLVELLWLRASATQIAYGASQRGANGAVSFDVFLNYAGAADLRAWNQFFLGLTPLVDFTFFGGFLVAALCLVACCSGPLDKPQRIFGAMAGITLLVATASPVATFVFYVWPLGWLFRHISLLVPAVKFFCILLAGATLDRLVTGWPRDSFRVGRVTVAAIATLSLVMLIVFAINPAALHGFITGLASGSPRLPFSDAALERAQIIRDAVLLIVSTAAFWMLLAAAGRKQSLERLAWTGALILFADVTTYHYLEMRARTFQLSDREAAIFDFTDLPYAANRIESADKVGNDRRWTFAKTESRLIGTRYWAEDLIWFMDAYQTSHRTVYWSQALDALVQALKSREGDRIVGAEPEMFAPPARNALMAAIAGLRDSKVRFFNRAIICPTVESASRIIANRAYRGQVALLVGSSVPGTAALACEDNSVSAEVVEANEAASARIVSFTSNRAEFDVVNPSDHALVMTYSDSWDAHWRAHIDAEETTVARSDLAYKAVVVPSGNHRVRFDYNEPMANAVFAAQAAASVAFLIFLAVLIRGTRATLSGTA